MTDQPAVPDSTGRTAAVLMAAQGLVLVGLGVVLGLDLARGDVGDATQAWTEIALLVVFAAGAFALAAGLLSGRGWARTPSLVWNLMLLPVAFSMLGAGQIPLGSAVLLLALVTIVFVWRAPSVDLEDAEG